MNYFLKFLSISILCILMFFVTTKNISASTLLGTVSGTNAGNIADGYVYGNFMFVPNNGNPAIDVYDISNVNSPYLYTSIPTSGGYENVSFLEYGSNLYIPNTSGYIDIIDASYVSYLGKIGPGSGGYRSRGVIYNDTLYVGNDSGVDIFSLSSNSYLGNFGISGTYNSDLVLSNDKLYAFRDSGLTDVFDVIDNRYMTTISSTVSSSYILSKPYLYGSMLYVPGNGGYDVIDTNTDTNVASILASGSREAVNFMLVGTKLYIPTNGNTIDVIDTTNNSFTNTSLSQAYYSGAYTDGSRIFLAGTSGSVDVFDPNTLSITESVITGHTYQYSNIINVGVLILPYKDGGIDIIDPGFKPNLISFTSTTSDGTYQYGDPAINITATFDVQINAGSTMTVTTDTGIQITLDQVAGNTLSGSYTIVGYEATTDLSINTIDSVMVNSYSPDYTVPSSPNNLQDTSNIAIQVSAPTLTSITSPNTNGSYTVGDTITISASFDRNIHPSSIMNVILDTGHAVDLVYAGTNILAGQYHVGFGETSDDLTVLSISSADVSSFNSFILPSGNNLGDLKDIQLFNSLPACSSVGVNYLGQSHLLNGKIYTLAYNNNLLRVNNVATGELYGIAFPTGFGNANGFMLTNGDKIYVSNNQVTPSKILVIDTLTDTSTEAVSSLPYVYREGVIANGKIYMPGVGINVFDLDSGLFASSISMPTIRTSNPVGYGQYIYSADIGTSIRKIDTTTGAIVGTITGGSGSYQYTSPFVLGTKLYFPINGSDIIDVLDTATDTITPLDTNHIRNGLKALVEGGNAYLPYNGGVDILNSSGSITTITTGTSFSYANSIPVKVGNKLYITGYSTPSQGISVFDLNTNTFLYNVNTPQYFLSNSPVLIGASLHYLGSGSTGTQTYQILDTTTDTLSPVSCFTPDIAAPVLVSFTSTTSNNTYGVGADINITATFDEALADGSTMTVTLDNGSVVTLSTVSGSTLSGTYTVLSNDSPTSDLSVSTITSASVIDKAITPNTSTSYTVPVTPNNIADTSDIIIDSIPATISNVHIESNNSNHSFAKLGDQVTISYDSNKQPSGGQLTIDGAVIAMSGGGCDPTSPPFHCWGIFDVTALQPVNDGLLIFSADIIDPFGNHTIVNSVSDGSSVTVDRLAPTTPTIVSIGGDTTIPYLTNDSTPDIVLTGLSAGDTVTAPGFTCDPVPATGTTVTCSPSSLLTNGTYTFTPTITDIAGSGTTEPSTSFTIDIIPPVLTIISPASGTSLQTGSTTITGTCETGLLINIFGTGFTPSPTTLSCIDGAFSTSVTVTGTMSLTVSQTDNAGNTGSAILNLQITSSSSGGGANGASGTTIFPFATITNQSPVTIPSLIGGGEPNVPKEFAPYICERYLRSYILPGANNNKEDVRKLQIFLNEKEKENLNIDGTFDSDDIAAVKRFQIKYEKQILSPWGLNGPTGRVYRTTAAKINLMMCNNSEKQYFNEYLKEGDVSFESVRVQDFLNIIFAPTSGYPNNGLQLTKTFTRETVEKLKEFQLVYKSAVLDPWGFKKATGRFYQTTRAASNALMGHSEGQTLLDNGKKTEAFKVQ